MFRFAMMALVGACSAAGAAQAVIALDQSRQSAPAPAPAYAAAAVSGAPAQVAKAADGHFWAEGVVASPDRGDARVRFLVDTGASAVALTPVDAKRLGLDPATLDYAYEVTTAGGGARAARVTLASVSVAGARVRDVDALVVERGLQTSLLGMSYLGRLSRFEATPQALVLRP